MWKILTWLVDAFGGFCAGFLAWLSVGSLIGDATARYFYASQSPDDCWPVRLGAEIEVQCAHPVANGLWRWLVQIPDLIVFRLGMTAWETVHGVISGDTLCIPDVYGWMITGIIGLMSLAGFNAWRTRSEIVAWVLILSLTTEIAAIAVWGYF